MTANIALGAYTYNSSTYYVNPYVSLTPSYAVDGKNLLNDSNAFCSLTVPADTKAQWIGVDLANLFSIFYVILYAGPDISGLRTRNDLDYLIVGVSNRSLDVYPPVRGTYDLCAQYPGVVASKQLVQLNCSSTTPPARYVILQQPANSTGYMSVCEWEIYGVPYGTYRKNILLQKPANSSSSYAEIYAPDKCGPLVANLMVDGYHDTQLLNCHCAHGNDSVGGPNWFMVDMQNFYYVDYIVFTSRGDCLIPGRADNFLIGFSNQSSSISPPVRKQYPLCGQFPGAVPPGAEVLLKCNANLPPYRFLIAQAAVSAADGHFTICELEAYEPLSLDSLVWKRKNGTYLGGYQVMSLKVRSIVACIHQCRQLKGGCDSINFNAAAAPTSKLCELNRHQNGFNNLNFNISWSFYVVQYY